MSRPLAGTRQCWWSFNKIDSNPSFDVNRPFLREKYPGICGFFPLSCKSGKGVPEFKEALLAELAKMNMLSIIWPTGWFAVKRKLEEMDKPYISVEEYTGYCAAAGIIGEESREILADFLHDLGVAVHFRDFILDAMSVFQSGLGYQCGLYDHHFRGDGGQQGLPGPEGRRQTAAAG